MADLDYEKESLLSFDEDWFHGKLTRVEAEQVLAACGTDCFLIRESKGAHVLSRSKNDKFAHVKIEYGFGWCKLLSSNKEFIGVQELVNYYQQSHHAIGTACVRKGVFIASPHRVKLASCCDSYRIWAGVRGYSAPRV